MNIDNYNIQVGDKVTYEFDGNTYIIVITSDGEIITKDAKILQIERPVYDMVVKVKEVEKKELLTDEEKSYLESILKFMHGKSIRQILVNKMYNSMSSIEFVTVEFFGDERREFSINNYEHKFDGLRDCEEYTLKELGLGE